VPSRGAAAKTSGGGLAAAMTQIKNTFGDGSIYRMGDEERVPVEYIPTGSILLDRALGVRGFPRGRIIEGYGPESSGKTSVALHAAANAQKMGLKVAFIDAEYALDPEWAATLGVDVDELIVSQPDNGEMALETVDILARSREVGLIIVDSVAALVPKAEIEGAMGDSHVGLQARLMSQALRKLTGLAAPDREKDWPGTTIYFINQLREKVGVMFGSPETTAGGKALKFYASVRLDIRRIETLKEGLEAVGNRVRVKVVKNKVARPHKSAEFDFMYDCGISRGGELIDLGLEFGIIRKAGAWYTCDGEQLGQGKENTRRFLQQSGVLQDSIAARIVEEMSPQAAIEAGAEAETVPWSEAKP
jgi:recombination protein RecA